MDFAAFAKGLFVWFCEVFKVEWFYRDAWF